MKLFIKLFIIIIILSAPTACFQVPQQHRIVGTNSIGQTILDTETVCTPLSQISHSENFLNASGFKILSWNLYKGFRRGWQDDLQRMAENSDLLLLQEGYLKEDLLAFLEDNRLYWGLAPGFAYQRIFSGVLTASKTTPKLSCSFRTNEPVIRLPKTTMITRYPLLGSDEDLLVVNIHGINFSLGLDAYRDQFKTLITLVADHKGPMLVAGDFNAWNLNRQLVVNEAANTLGLTSLDIQADHRVTLFGYPLDNIYYRGLVVERAVSIEVVSSDHNPLIVIFKTSSSGRASQVTKANRELTLKRK